MQTQHYTQIARKTTLTLFTAQSFGSAALIAASTVNAIAGDQLSGNPAWAGIPSAVVQLGAAFGAIGGGYALDRLGRRVGLSTGILLGAVGGLVAVSALMMESFLVFLVGMAVLGVGRASIQLGRFAAAEVHPPTARGQAISNVVIGGTFGAVLGPLLVGPTGAAALHFGLNELAGPFMFTAVVLVIAAGVVFIWLRPDPREIGQQIARLYPETVIRTGQTRSTSEIIQTPAAFVAVSAMVLGQVVMVALMVITGLHMKHNQHSLAAISVVISSHTLGMYAFSILSGRLTDRWGRGPVIMTGAGFLLLASMIAPLSPGVFPLSVALFLLGLGWNLCYVGGSALLSDQLSPEERSKTQGVNDWLIGLATAGASFGSGLVFAGYGYPAIGALCGVVALGLMGLVVRWMRQEKVLSVA